MSRRHECGLLERDAELAVVDRLVAAVAGGTGGLLLVEGPAGIGKSALLRVTRARARERELQVLAARGSLLERDFAFGVARSLFEPPLVAARPEARRRLLAGAAAPASTVLDVAGDDVAAPPTGRSLLAGLHALYWLATNLAERAPLLVALDDAQWADAPSLRALAYLLGRLEDLPILVAVTVRRVGQQPVDPLVDALRAVATTTIRPEPLSPSAAAALTGRMLGPAAEAAFCAACHEASAGNPLLLTALLRALHEAEVQPVAGRIDAVRERAPSIVTAFVLPRLQGLSPQARAVAAAVAVLGPATALRYVAALSRLDVAAASDGCDELVAAEILAPGRPLAFAHPLFDQAVDALMSDAERHHAHRRAAQVLADEAAAPETVAAHLLLVEPLADRWVVERLVAAADHASRKGAARTAATYLDRAVQEPPAPDERSAVLAALGRAQLFLGGSTGLTTLRAALELAGGPRPRGRIALDLGRALWTLNDHRGAVEVLAAAADDLADTDAELRRNLDAQLVGLAWIVPEARPRAAERLRRVDRGARPGGLAACQVLVNRAMDQLQVPGQADRAVTLAEEAIDGLRDVDTGVVRLATTVLMAADRLDAAQRVLEQVISVGRTRSAQWEIAAGQAILAQVAYRRGTIREAEAESRAAMETSAEHDFEPTQEYLDAWLGLALVERGALIEASTVLDGPRAGSPFLLTARGRLCCALGRPADGLTHHLAVGRMLAARRFRHPGAVPWRSEAALALHQLGESARAARLVDEEIAEARRFGAVRTLGIALRVAGLVRGRTDLLAEAVTVLEPSPARLEHARALVELGAALRRTNNRVAARDQLRHGLDLAHRCGAAALEERARDELRSAGGRPRRLLLTGPSALTPSERRVATMAARAMSNREIAQSLFVTVKTVELHLGNAYRKLGVTSRSGLPGTLGAE